MTKTINGSSLTVPGDVEWQKRRPQNGYSYLEVLREMERRKKGDCLLPPETRNSVFQAGTNVLATKYVISATLAGLMSVYKLTPERLLTLFGCEERDSADTLLMCILNPYLKTEGADISNHAVVDELFPALDLNRKS